MSPALLALILARGAVAAPEPAAAIGAPAEPDAAVTDTASRLVAHRAFLEGRLAFEAQNWPSALAELARARVGLDPTADGALLAATGWMEAQAYLALGATFPAWLALREVDVAAFDVPDADLTLQLHRGLLLARAERWEAAAAMLLLPGLLLDAPGDRLAALRASAKSLHALRRTAEARVAATEAVTLVDPVTDPLLAASVRRDLATLHAATADYTGAVGVLEPALAYATAAGSAEWEAALALDLGDAWAALGDRDTARDAYLRARSVATGRPGDRARAQAGLAQLAARTRSPAAPLAFARAHRWARPDPAAAAEVSERRAVVADETRRPRAHLRWSRDAAARWAEAGVPAAAARAEAEALVVALGLGDAVAVRVLDDVRARGGFEIDLLVGVARGLRAQGASTAAVYTLLATRSFPEPTAARRAQSLATAGLRGLAAGGEPTRGLVVTDIRSGSAAEALGIELGDVLVAYAALPFAHPRDLPAALYTNGVGGSLVILGAAGRREVVVPTLALGVTVEAL